MENREMFLLDVISQILYKDSIGIDATNSLKDKILDKEEYIQNLPLLDGYPGTVENSITVKHNSYNLIDFGWPEVDLITDKVKQFTNLIIKDNENVYIKMWANIYRKGEYITKHSHVHHTQKPIYKTIFSGHCFLYSTQPTSTTFYFGPNEEEIDIANVPGEIDIFSSLVPHEFKPWDGELRVGLAFDIVIGDEERLNNIFNKETYKKI
jgi:hypothetical protein